MLPESLILGQVNPKDEPILFLISGLQTYLGKYLDYSKSMKLTNSYFAGNYFLITENEMICVVFNPHERKTKPIFITRKFNSFASDFNQFIKDLPDLVEKSEFDNNEWKLSNWFLTMLDKVPNIPFNSLVKNG